MNATNNILACLGGHSISSEKIKFPNQISVKERESAIK
jgi:hypothetical protein